MLSTGAIQTIGTINDNVTQYNKGLIAHSELVSYFNVPNGNDSIEQVILVAAILELVSVLLCWLLTVAYDRYKSKCSRYASNRQNTQGWV